MKKATNLLRSVARVLTGRTPGAKREAEVRCQRASDKIDEDAKERAAASVHFKRASKNLKNALDKNSTLSERVCQIRKERMA